MNLALNTNNQLNELIEIVLHSTNSKIIKANNNIVYCSIYKGIAGIFRKDNEISFNFGQKICGIVKKELNNYGFFTSDELPRYGISRTIKKELLAKCNASDIDLIAIFAYPYDIALKTKIMLDKILSENIINK